MLQKKLPLLIGRLMPRGGLLLAVWLLINLTIQPLANLSASSSPDNLIPGISAQIETSANAGIAPPDFFGVVGRDPWYEWGTDARNPDKPNLAFQEKMAQQLQRMGAKWVRIEIKADARPDARGGFIDWRKYDPFILEIAPRYGLKILALLGADILIAKNGTFDADLAYEHFNDNPDAPDGTNNYLRFFGGRVKEIADHYGAKVGAYEVLNEPNSWFGFKAHPENIGALFSYTYSRVKPGQPQAQILLGATIATGDPKLDHVNYLTDIYQSPPIKSHFSGNNRFPWDGVAWHPYFDSPWDSIYTVQQALEVMRKQGDAAKIWVTESGQFSSSMTDECQARTSTASSQDEAQAHYLRVLYGELAKNSGVAAVFWFKYEDFYDAAGRLISLGLVHLETITPTRYDPYGDVARYKPAYKAYMFLARPGLPTDRVAAPANSNGVYYFPQTGHTLSGAFLQYWLKNGGTDLFGLPLTEPFEEIHPDSGQKIIVQWFERERFEYHGYIKDPKYQVLLGLLGKEYIGMQCRIFPRANPIPPAPTPTPPPPPPVTPGKPTPTNPPPPPPVNDRVYFKETGHNLVGSFKTFWETRGGLAIFGYPISEEFGEVNPADGKTYVVQYFERARFEYHPEKKGTPYEVELGILSREFLKAKGWMN